MISGLLPLLAGILCALVAITRVIALKSKKDQNKD